MNAVISYETSTRIKNLFYSLWNTFLVIMAWDEMDFFMCGRWDRQRHVPLSLTPGLFGGPNEALSVVTLSILDSGSIVRIPMCPCLWICVFVSSASSAARVRWINGHEECYNLKHCKTILWLIMQMIPCPALILCLIFCLRVMVFIICFLNLCCVFVMRAVDQSIILFFFSLKCKIKSFSSFYMILQFVFQF